MSSASEIDARLERRLREASAVIQAKKEEAYRKNQAKRRWEKTRRLTDAVERSQVSFAAAQHGGRDKRGAGSDRRPSIAAATERRTSLAAEHGLASVVHNVRRLPGNGEASPAHALALPSKPPGERPRAAASVSTAPRISSRPDRPSTAAADGGPRRHGGRGIRSARPRSALSAPVYNDPPSYSGLRAATLARAEMWAHHELHEGEIHERRRSKAAQKAKLRRFLERESQAAFEHAGVEVLDTESEAEAKLAAAIERATKEAKARFDADLSCAKAYYPYLFSAELHRGISR